MPLACTSAASTAPPGIVPAQTARPIRTVAHTISPSTRAKRIQIDDPLSFWNDGGYTLLVPAVRMSIPPGGAAGTAIFFKLPKGAPIVATRHGSDVVPSSFIFPPGTAADRVAYVVVEDESGQPSVRVLDVRGTRIDSDGSQLFRVLRPGGPEPTAPMIGYEWPRGDMAARDDATSRLLDELRGLQQPISERPPSPQALARLALLNHCEICHMPNKPPSPPSSQLPSWPTDGSGFYVPLGVLMDHEPLSTQPSLHDPNAEDPYIQTSCGTTPAKVDGDPNNRFFTCADENRLPMGRRDIRRGMLEEDAYTMLVCGARTLLFERMDAEAQKDFAPLLEECRGEPDRLVRYARTPLGTSRLVVSH